MSYEYNEEITITVDGEDVSFCLSVDVEMTHAGYSASGPTLSGPGEPAEGPEFECGNPYIYLGGKVVRLNAKTLETILGEKRMTKFYEAAEEKAAEEWEPDYQEE